MELVVHPDRLERARICGLGEVAHRRPLLGWGNPGQIQSPALRYEHPESHRAILISAGPAPAAQAREGSLSAPWPGAATSLRALRGLSSRSSCDYCGICRANGRIGSLDLRISSGGD